MIKTKPVFELPPLAPAKSTRASLPTKAKAERALRRELFTVAPVIAVTLGMSIDFVYDAMRKGDIPSIRVGNKFRIPTAPYRALLPPESDEDEEDEEDEEDKEDKAA